MQKQQIMANLNNIIRENIRRALLEMDLVPTDSQGNSILVKKRSSNAWKMIYRLMDNVKTSMDYTYKDKSGNITRQDVYDIVDYINNGIQGILKNTVNSK